MCYKCANFSYNFSLDDSSACRFTFNLSLINDSYLSIRDAIDEADEADEEEEDDDVEEGDEANNGRSGLFADEDAVGFDFGWDLKDAEEVDIKSIQLRKNDEIDKLN